ncbi:hypothetical protein [Ursidibacter sp. B-7004-1]
MKKFIALTAVSYSKDKDGKRFAEEHCLMIDIDFIDGFTDALIPDDDFDLEGISKVKFKQEGSRVFLNKKGQEFFNNKIFNLSLCNECISDDCVFVTEELDDIKKMLF